MAALKFIDSHNMIAFLNKSADSKGFEQIVDFLNAHTIHYALTVNPIVYVSCIKQLWATAKVKTVNEEVHMQALMDKKKVIITESSVRSDLRLDDAEGVECLPNTTIFDQLALMGYENLTQKLTFYKVFFSPQWKFLVYTILQCLSAKTTAWNKFSSTMASAIICLATNQNFNFSKYIFDNLVKNLEGGDMGEEPTVSTDHTPIIQPSTSQSQKKQARRKKRKETKIPSSSGPEESIPDEAINVEYVPTHSNDPLLSGDDRLKLTELTNLCTKLSSRVKELKDDLKKTKLVYGKALTKLVKKFKKLERKHQSNKARRRSSLILSDEEEDLSNQEDVFNQRDIIANIDQDAWVTLINETQERIDNEVFAEQAEKEQAKKVYAQATSLSVDEVTLATTLAALKSAKPKEKEPSVQVTTTAAIIVDSTVVATAVTTPTIAADPKAKGVVIQEPSVTSRLVSSQQSLQAKTQDKGKGILIEKPVKLSKKDQLKAYEELAKELQAEEEEAARVEKER
ncbi:hypothetical protein Tco_1170057 [Tanacetum coccineum]